MITQAGLGLPSAPQPWLAGSSPSDSCFGHVPKVGTAFQPSTQPWEGGEKKQREKGAGLILSVCLCSVSRQCSMPEPAASISPISCAQQLKTSLVLFQLSLPAQHTLPLSAIPPACPSSSSPWGPGCTELCTWRGELREHKEQSQGLRWSQLCSMPQFSLGNYADDAELLHCL